MKEFLQNVKYTALIIALVVVAGIGIVAILDVLERWIGIESVAGILITLLAIQVYCWVRLARKGFNNNEE